ncbi:glycosyltransferase [Bdellovibrionota bacterium FG-2]
MKVLMLGWEYPPHINGGLGTACEGLTTALAKNGVKIDFVLPKVFGSEKAPHMNLLNAQRTKQGFTHHILREITHQVTPTESVESSKTITEEHRSEVTSEERSEQVEFIEIPSWLNPYARPELEARLRHSRKISRKEFSTTSTGVELVHSMLPGKVSQILREFPFAIENPEQYGTDLLSEVNRYTYRAVTLAQDREFDIVHAHDWMTYPAGVAIAKMRGVPLVVHVHSLEFDRSGKSVNHRIHEIEAAGVHAADAVIAVSYYTRSVIHEQHKVPLSKISVVHNGVYSSDTISLYRKEKQADTKVVLFLGRVTFQKGPDYFVEAAAKVVSLMPNVTFVMAGTGDMLPQLMERVSELNLNRNFVFTGFLKGPEVERMFSLADLYVMPSVSEPFGITPLEAMSHDVPVIISRQSGVAEVLQSALKVNFWDTDTLSHFILGVLKYPEIREDVLERAKEEISRLRWDAAAKKTFSVYLSALGREA